MTRIGKALRGALALALLGALACEQEAPPRKNGAEKPGTPSGAGTGTRPEAAVKATSPSGRSEPKQNAAPAAPKVPSWPFDAAEAKRRQKAAAEKLGVPIEQEVALGGGVKLTLVLVPPGQFLIGSPGHETGRYDDEPLHPVTIAAPFWMSKYEVTQEQWEALMGDNPSQFKGPKNPVDSVQGRELEFLLKLNEKVSSGGFGLPTEAQWEWACRAGSDKAFHFGDDADALAKYGWHAKNAQGKTRPVGSLLPNPWGLHDLHGNVLERCSSAYSPDYQGPETPVAESLGARGVWRGGAWDDKAENCRSALRCRSLARPSDLPHFGLRLVRSVAAGPERRGPPPYPQWPFAAAAAKQRQEETAKALGLKAEEEIALGRGQKLKLVLIPAGDFDMGSPLAVPAAVQRWGGRAELYYAEQPVHRVRISKPFYLGQCEVTRGQFAAFIEETAYLTEAERKGTAYGLKVGQAAGVAAGVTWRAPGFPQNDDHPVVCVSWNDAQQFTDWLSRKTGKSFSLPTEAQWEYACRAGTATAWFWGDQEAGAQGKANVTGEDEAPASDPRFVGVKDGHRWTAPAAGFAANAFGLHDMLGNVWEWVLDWYDADFYAHAPQEDPAGPMKGETSVVRGGSWSSSPRLCRSAARLAAHPSHSFYICGFRVARRLNVETEPAPPLPKLAAPPQPWKNPVFPPPPDEPPTGPVAMYTAWPFDATEAKRRQEETARTLRVPTEDAVDLGRGEKLFLVLIPAGEFPMGSSLAAEQAAARWGGDAADYRADLPRHRVRLTRPFYLAKCEVTRAQFAAFIQETGYKTEAERSGVASTLRDKKWDLADDATWQSPGLTQANSHPVTCVSWTDARAFCDWLSAKTHKPFALPTEAQWECACRAGSDTLWPWGDREEDAQGKANVAGEGEEMAWRKGEGFAGVRDGLSYPAPVASFAPNAFGLFDMIGNVSEWCADVYDERYYSACPPTDPRGPAEGSCRAVRGGGWYSPPGRGHSAARAGDRPRLGSLRTGFRIARTLK